MSDQVAIVAGAGGELGRATAATLAGTGFTVVAIDRSEAGLQELPDVVRRGGRPDRDRLSQSRSSSASPPRWALRRARERGRSIRVRRCADDHAGVAASDARGEPRHSTVAEPSCSAPHAAARLRRHRHVAARPATEPTAGMAAYSVSKAALVH